MIFTNVMKNLFVVKQLTPYKEAAVQWFSTK